MTVEAKNGLTGIFFLSRAGAGLKLIDVGGFEPPVKKLKLAIQVEPFLTLPLLNLLFSIASRSLSATVPGLVFEEFNVGTYSASKASFLLNQYRVARTIFFL